MSPTFEAMVQAEYARICKREEEKHARAALVQNEQESAIVDALDKRIENLETLRDMAGYDYEAACHADDNKRMKKALRELVTLDNQIESARIKKQKAAKMYA